MPKKLSTQEKARRMWVRALRSGKYGWGKGKLNPEEGKFCCLGVLCEIAVKHGVIKHYDAEDGYLSNYIKVKNWVGLQDDGGVYGANGLIGINDQSSRNPFKKIANIIERKPAGLFVEVSK